MLEVIGDIPYLSPGEPRHKPRRCTSKGCPLCGRGRSKMCHPEPAAPSVAVESGPGSPGADPSSSS
eukprot:11928431-Alexandrium_andersonii.AAC.1